MASLLHFVTLATASKPFPFSSSHPQLASVSIAPRRPASHGSFVVLRSLYHASRRRACRPRLSSSDSGVPGEEDPEPLVQELRVPDAWLIPSNAIKESEWLRVTLHKWLDEEYCPETTNIEISKLSARSFYESLMAKQTDLGEILLKMVRDLETLSYQESFHGPFSAANAAMHLITSRMELMADR
ncbi:uncharacterized protein LOC103714869 [Phoenix dactylifera]|uniref:Uncharacterized protein LOC103714869 n=1 Tax=Phoenix dactylifera TaxID=42345 RepID=A0A8B7CJJ6_PHODC|nr:uncharacterized protein LOC103714869 [Phoenix dactylifera]